MDFYDRVLVQLRGEVHPEASTLVVAGGEVDRDSLMRAGFTDVTISNLDVRLSGDEFAPYRWSFQDAETLSFADDAFEQVIVHAGLHHCASPHKALVEMYRVARRSVLAFEARDWSLMRAAISIGLTGDYEVEAVVANGLKFGGWRNGEIPNFVYRWTEREVRKTIASYDPRGPVPSRFFYGLRLPTERLAIGTSLAKTLALKMAAFPVRAMFALMPKQGNEFAFWLGKPTVFHPWLDEAGSPNRAWLSPPYRIPQQDSALQPA